MMKYLKLKPHKVVKALALVTTILGLSCSLQLSGGEVSNPMLEVSGDPDALIWNERAYVFLPHNKVYYAFSSLDFKEWTNEGKVFDKKDCKGLWAPDVYEHVDGKFYLYYTCNVGPGLDKRVGDKDIGVAVGDSPLGPFEDLGLLFEDDYALIDPNLFRDEDGELYLYYKSRRMYGTGSRIIVQKMDTPTTLDKDVPPHELIHTRQTAIWAGTVVEQPFVHRSGEWYFLFFSGGAGSKVDYAIGLATSRSPMGPFKLDEENPIVKKDAAKNIYAPGASSLFEDSEGGIWMVYRQKSGPENGWGDRFVAIDPVQFEGRKAIIQATKGEPMRAPTLKTESIEKAK